MNLSIDIAFDPICPWCLIGKRHLARALARLADIEPEVTTQVRWHAVQLLPDLPIGGLPFAEFYIRRLGSLQAVLARQAQVNAAAASAGLQINFSRIARMPNTSLALRLLDHVTRVGSPKQMDAVIEQLFDAHFLRGSDIGNTETLVTLAQAAGFDGKTVHTLLSDSAAADSAQDPRPQFSEGVPHFVFNGQYALAGAHPPKVMLHAMLHALGQNAPLEGSAA